MWKETQMKESQTTFSFYLQQLTQVTNPASVHFGLRLRKFRVHHGSSTTLSRDTLAVICARKDDPVLSIRNSSNRKYNRAQSCSEGLIYTVFNSRVESYPSETSEVFSQ